MTPPTTFGRAVRDLARAARWHRRLLAAGLAAAAVAAGLHALSPARPPTTSVLVFARDLPGGAPLAAADLSTRALPAAAVPPSAISDPGAVTGRLLAGPVRSGEVVTGTRLLGPALLAGYGADLVAAPVRVAEPGAVAVVAAGDRVDVLAAAVTDPATAAVTDPATTAAPAAAHVVARDAPVLAIPAGDDAAVDGALLVLAVPASTAATLAQAAVSARLSVVVRPRVLDIDTSGP